MKSYCMKHRDFLNWTPLVNFGKTYLGAQMELEGMLWCKINQFRMYKRMGTTPDTHIPSKLENSSPSLFFCKNKRQEPDMRTNFLSVHFRATGDTHAARDIAEVSILALLQ